jgi:hypothetical protein
MPSRAAVFRFLLLAAVMGVVYGQAPLYYSNQNQYFLHGLARAGDGFLADDWLARTRDPTPVFSGLVCFTARYLHPVLFYGYYALLLGCYAAALLAVFRSLSAAQGSRLPSPPARSYVGRAFRFVAGNDAGRLSGEEKAGRWPVFLALLLLLHSALLRWASYRWAGLDYPWYFQAGVAGQYVLGPVLQPSAFGVLLLVAVALFLHDRPLLAAGCVGLAATFHSTYLLPGAMLTAAFLAVLLGRGQVLRAALVGGLTLALVLPVTLYVVLAFAPTNRETLATAARILTTFRIPHHCQVRLWLDPIAAAQIAWVVLALLRARCTPLAPLIGIPFALSAVLTLAQVITGSDTLALLFPWRVSAVLVPLATTVMLYRLLDDVPAFETARGRGTLLALTAGLAAGGAWLMLTHQGYQANDNELGVLAYVRGHKEKGDVYVIPVRVPRLGATTRGSLSSDFKPLPGKRADDRLIPVDLQRFRLPTGAPIYVDFKSIPYQDIDVHEWRLRVADVERVQHELHLRRWQEAYDLLRQTGATHLVWHASQELTDPHFQKLYADPFYCVYRLRPASPE